MNYQVTVKYGAEGASTQDVSNVSELSFFDDAYYFFNDANEILFIAPQSSVVYIKKY